MGSMRSIILRNAYAFIASLTISFAFCCVGMLALTIFLASCLFRSEAEIAATVTFDHVSLDDVSIVATHEQIFSPDAHAYMIFDAEREQVAKFAQKYADGTPIDEFPTTRAEIGREGWTSAVGFPEWDLTEISDGRYFKRNDTNGFLSIDMERSRVYVFR